jgi:transcriptional regulator with XRE-family HTH domain
MHETFFESQGRKLGLTQRDVAEALPPRPNGRTWTPAAIGKWWRGATAPPIGLADDLARIYRVSRQRILEEIHAIATSLRSETAAAK